MKKLKKILIEQGLPILLTFITFCGLATVLYGILLFINTLNLKSPIVLDFRRREVLLGIIIYLKTAIDFAIFIGNLMHTNPGWKKRMLLYSNMQVTSLFLLTSCGMIANGMYVRLRPGHWGKLTTYNP